MNAMLIVFKHCHYLSHSVIFLVRNKCKAMVVSELISQLHTTSPMFEGISLSENNENIYCLNFSLSYLGFYLWGRLNCLGKRSKKAVILPQQILPYLNKKDIKCIQKEIVRLECLSSLLLF